MWEPSKATVSWSWSSPPGHGNWEEPGGPCPWDKWWIPTLVLITSAEQCTDLLDTRVSALRLRSSLLLLRSSLLTPPPIPSLLCWHFRLYFTCSLHSALSSGAWNPPLLSLGFFIAFLFARHPTVQLFFVARWTIKYSDNKFTLRVGDGLNQ